MILSFLTTSDAKLAESLVPILSRRSGPDPITCKISSRGTRTYFDGKYWSINAPAVGDWKIPTESARAELRQRLIAQLKSCYTDSTVQVIDYGTKPSPTYWRENLLAEERIDGAGVMGNTSSLLIDYQSGEILSATRRSHYVPFRETRTSVESEVDNEIIRREGKFDSKTVLRRWWPLNQVRPTLAKGDRANQVVLLDMITVKRGAEELVYFFNQAGRPELYPERFAPHPYKGPPPPAR